MMKNKPLILISNDDGYQAKGIRSLIDMLRGMGRIVVCAPDSARSGFSCAFSCTTPLTLTLRERYVGANASERLGSGQAGIATLGSVASHDTSADVEIWSTNGTPVDCVKLALSEILVDERPDIVIGGINHGDNGSVNSHYSGTMGVVMEGCMKYLPSVAFSLCDFNADADFEPLRPYVQKITQRVLSQGLPKGVCLNVNFPVAKEFKGVRLCRMSPGSWLQELTRCHHPRGYDYYWMVGHYHNDAPEAEDTDNWAVTHGYVSITPTLIDLTAYNAFDALIDLEK